MEGIFIINFNMLVVRHIKGSTMINKLKNKILKLLRVIPNKEIVTMATKEELLNQQRIGSGSIKLLCCGGETYLEDWELEDLENIPDFKDFLKIRRLLIKAIRVWVEDNYFNPSLELSYFNPKVILISWSGVRTHSSRGHIKKYNNIQFYGFKIQHLKTESLRIGI